MKVGVLFSGGKDSCLALHRAQEAGYEIGCLISIISKNPESYMFHVPNIELCALQAEAMELPLLQVETEGEKEVELEDLRNAIAKTKDDVDIEGIVTGAVGSTYQATRIQTICDQLDLWCFNPLWQIDQLQLLQEILDLDFDIRIAGVFGYPLDASWLGQSIDTAMVKRLADLWETIGLNPAGEGGEIETLAVDGPIFRKKLKILDARFDYENHAGTYQVVDAVLEEKE